MHKNKINTANISSTQQATNFSEKVRSKKVIAVLPAYNAEKTLQHTLDDIDRNWIDEILLVDDASTDKTAEISRALGLPTFVHKHNRGYGGNQKTCYHKALQRGADIVIMVHPDHQYNPKLIPELLKPLLNEKADAVFGSRMAVKGSARKGGMPWWKYMANIALTNFENFFLGLHLTEYHTGFRAYSRKVLETLPLKRLSDDFVFDTQIIIQMILHGFNRIKEVPIETRYFDEASQIGLKRSMEYGIGIVVNIIKYLLTVWHIKEFPEYVK